MHPTRPAAETWDQFAIAHPQAHLLQTTPWGTLKSQFGWTDERVAVTGPDQAPVAGAQLLYRRLPLGLGTLAYVPKGPLVDWQDHAQVHALVEALDQTARAHGAIALTVEPELPDTAAHAAALTHAGFVPGVTAVQPRRTLVVDLTPDREHILAAMKSKTRYNIRLAGRKGVNVYQGTAADVETFNQLMQVTSSRNEFGVHSANYYRRAFKCFAPRDQVALFLADYEGQPLAGVMVFALGQTAWYFYGASSNAHRNLMAPYALQWAAMCWTKDRGCTTYDLWGVPDYDEETLEAQFTERQDGLWGVYRFKRGFGGQLTRTIGAWDRAYRPLRYRLYRWALRWR
jgi:lipid II:glycine glycyltransferase (peptidoglycan interpeptide bridge formation enzyme)